eukprot:441501-Amphidinium_carterae.1
MDWKRRDPNPRKARPMCVGQKEPQFGVALVGVQFSPCGNTTGCLETQKGKTGQLDFNISKTCFIESIGVECSKHHIVQRKATGQGERFGRPHESCRNHRKGWGYEVLPDVFPQCSCRRTCI